MSEKKMVRRSVAIALGIICIILVAGLGVVLYMGYSPTATNSVSSLQDKINQLQSWLDGNKTLLSQTQTWLDGNITTYNNYVNDHSHTNSEYDAMWTPKLITIDLTGSDSRPLFGTPYLHVSGYVVNVHMNWAYDCKLHVVAYQSGGVTAVDTYINLGTIIGESSTQVSSNVYYTGSSLSSWTITQQWTFTTP
jgi:hypothetical protein